MGRFIIFFLHWIMPDFFRPAFDNCWCFIDGTVRAILQYQRVLYMMGINVFMYFSFADFKKHLKSFFDSNGKNACHLGLLKKLPHLYLLEIQHFAFDPPFHKNTSGWLLLNIRYLLVFYYQENLYLFYHCNFFLVFMYYTLVHNQTLF